MKKYVAFTTTFIIVFLVCIGSAYSVRDEPSEFFSPEIEIHRTYDLQSLDTGNIDDSAVADFVTRFYEFCLNRDPDQAGLDGWVKALRNGWVTGADLAEGFIFSPEFMNSNMSDEAFVTILYRAFFDREADLPGFVGWFTELQRGTSRASVLEGFVYSEEFSNLCDKYGITPYPRDLVEDFVTRFYQECLGREPDLGGLQGWAKALRNGWVTGEEIAEGFILSQEFENLSTSDTVFLNILYRAFFNREPDDVGRNGWLSALQGGKARTAVLEGFIHSEEFFRLCSEYGIIAVENSLDHDGDKDGYTENQGDCNDYDNTIHPGADEICGDAVDQDCSGDDSACVLDPLDMDDDGDGYTENQGDCSDFDNSIHPGASEICGDGLDQDCNGYDLECGRVQCCECKWTCRFRNQYGSGTATSSATTRTSGYFDDCEAECDDLANDPNSECVSNISMVYARPCTGQ